MRRTLVALMALAALIGIVVHVDSQNETAVETGSAFGSSIPPGYRDWRLVSVAREEGELDDLRAVLGNDTAIEAYREGAPRFPDGAIIARLAWSYQPSAENNKAFGRRQSFVAGAPKNGVQFMLKDSKRHASTGGWAFAQFNAGQPAGESQLETCFPCHRAVEARDFVFTRYAATEQESDPT